MVKYRQIAAQKQNPQRSQWKLKLSHREVSDR
jgi:hypothetical protein